MKIKKKYNCHVQKTSQCNAGCIKTIHPYLAAEVVIIINEIDIEEDLGHTFGIILGRVEYGNSEWTLKEENALYINTNKCDPLHGLFCIKLSIELSDSTKGLIKIALMAFDVLKLTM